MKTDQMISKKCTGQLTDEYKKQYHSYPFFM